MINTDDRKFSKPYKRTPWSKWMMNIWEAMDLDYTIANKVGISNSGNETRGLIYNPLQGKNYILAMIKKIVYVEKEPEIIIEHWFFSQPTVNLYFLDNKIVTDIEYNIVFFEDEVHISFEEDFVWYIVLT